MAVDEEVLPALCVRRRRAARGAMPCSPTAFPSFFSSVSSHSPKSSEAREFPLSLPVDHHRTPKSAHRLTIVAHSPK